MSLKAGESTLELIMWFSEYIFVVRVREVLYRALIGEESPAF